MRREAVAVRMRSQVRAEDELMRFPNTLVFIQCIARYVIELTILWWPVFAETGFWTALVLTLITAEAEYHHGRRQGWWQ